MRWKRGGWGVNTIVEHLLSEGFPAENINIGYAGYTRNGRNVELESLSPLKGTYNPGNGDTTGTFESGTNEWYDVIYNYRIWKTRKAAMVSTFTPIRSLMLTTCITRNPSCSCLWILHVQ